MEPNLELEILDMKVENYHKEKNKCEQTCKNFGERIGEMEKCDAVMENRMITVEAAVKEIQKVATSLQIRIGFIVAAIMGGFKLFDKFGN